MPERYESLRDDVQDWFAAARADGWLTDAEAAVVESAQTAAPADLFEAGAPRPMVVAFFGGTGVGKTSLLNRLAGSPIARVGVERPTSTQATLFLHREAPLAALADELASTVAVERHAIDAWRDVAWLDTPDVNSVEIENRRRALLWLGHVDLVLYVVSPERYRDDRGWRVLRERAGRHGWMFVINRWDEGAPPQRDDFLRVLRDGGFEEPWLFTTSCRACSAAQARAQASPPRRAGANVHDQEMQDGFAALQRTIVGLLSEHLAVELDRLGLRARAGALADALARARPRLGDREAWGTTIQRLERSGASLVDQVCDGLSWSIHLHAQRLAGPAAPRPGAGAPLDQAGGPIRLWDEWAQARLAELAQRVEVELARSEIAVTPFRAAVGPRLESLGAGVDAKVDSAWRVGMAHPGNGLVRGMRRLARWGTFLLPAAAVSLVAFNLVTTYWRATWGQGEFPGIGFAASSALLLALALAAPLGLERWLRPNWQRVAEQALRRGLRDGMQEAVASLRQAAVATAEAAVERLRQADALSERLREFGSLGGVPAAGVRRTMADSVRQSARDPMLER